jgi:hypothetical protein
MLADSELAQWQWTEVQVVRGSIGWNTMSTSGTGGNYALTSVDLLRVANRGAVVANVACRVVHKPIKVKQRQVTRARRTSGSTAAPNLKAV